MDYTDKLDILYARRSSEDGKDGESIENQIALLQQYAIEHGYYNTKILADDGYSGTNFNRPAFQEALSLIQHRRVGRFIVKDLSRFGRNTVEVGRYTNIVFPRYGVELISVHDGSEAVNMDDISMQFKSMMNEFYAKDISDKQKLSLQARSKSGQHIASVPAYGYKLDPNDKHKWIIDEATAPTVRLIFKLYNEGMQVSEIARKLNAENHPAPSKRKGNKWSHSSVSAVLKRQEYCGDTVNFKTCHASFKDKQVIYRKEEDYVIIYDTQEAIITREVYEQAKKRRISTKRVKKLAEFHLLNNLVYCHECGENMYRNLKGYADGKCYVLMCNGYKKKKNCSSHYIRETELNERVIEKIRLLIDTYKADSDFCRRTVTKYICDSIDGERKALRTRLSEIDKRLSELRLSERQYFDEKIKGNVSQDTFVNLTMSLNEEINTLCTENGKIMMKLDTLADRKKSVTGFMTRLSMVTDGSSDEYLVEQLVEKVTVSETANGVTVYVHYYGVGILDF